MPQHRSPKRTYQSRYGGGWVTAAQRLAEIMVERQASRQEKQLPTQFWNNPKWNRIYLLQIRSAHSLLRLYSMEAILKAIESDAGKHIYSLAPEFLDPIISAAQQQIDKAQKVTPSLDTDVNECPRMPVGKTPKPKDL